jgi:hypothetical protein
VKKLILIAGIVLASSGAAQAQAPVADYYSTTSKLNGLTLPAGTTIEAYDGQSIRCGTATANADGGFLIHVYGNDPLTQGIDEGATEGETLTWKMANTTPETAAWVSTLIGLFADLRFENGAAKEIRLEAMITAVEVNSWGAVKSHFRP